MVVEKGKKLLNKDRIAAILWFAAAAYVWYEASGYPVSLLDKVGPAKYPHLLSALIAIGAVALFITSKNQDGEEKKESVKDYRSLLFVILTIAVYLAIFNLAGFVISTIVFLMAMCLYFDTREPRERLKGAIPYSVGFTIVIYLFFAKALGVQLPTLFL